MLVLSYTMPQTVQKGDFVEVEYTGRIKDDISAFDTTSTEEAKKAGIFSNNAEYGPVIICIGQNDVLPGLDEKLDGAETEKDYHFEIPAERAFGKKDAKLIQLIPARKFTEQNVRPMPGLQINVDGYVGIIKSVAGGRTLVDFNHPLAGRELSYDIKVLRKITDKNEKIRSLFKLHLNLAPKEVMIEGDNVLIPLKPQFIGTVQNDIMRKVKQLISEAIEVKFVTPENGDKNK